MIQRVKIPMDKEVQGVSMQEVSELGRAISKGFALINEMSKNSYESSWQRYCWQQEMTRIQCRKVERDLYVVQLWKYELYPFSKYEGAFLKSTNIPVKFIHWNWYAVSEAVDFQTAKQVAFQLYAFFSQSK